jgi:hypothetical protein
VIPVEETVVPSTTAPITRRLPWSYVVHSSADIPTEFEDERLNRM